MAEIFKTDLILGEDCDEDSSKECSWDDEFKYSSPEDAAGGMLGRRDSGGAKGAHSFIANRVSIKNRAAVIMDNEATAMEGHASGWSNHPSECNI